MSSVQVKTNSSPVACFGVAERIVAEDYLAIGTFSFSWLHFVTLCLSCLSCSYHVWTVLHFDPTRVKQGMVVVCLGKTELKRLLQRETSTCTPK